MIGLIAHEILKSKIHSWEVFYILTCVSTPESMPFKNVFTQETTTQRPTQMRFSVSGLIYVMVRAHVCKCILTASNTLVTASHSSSDAKM